LRIPLQGKEALIMITDINIRIAAVEDAGELLAIYAPYVRNTAISFEWEVPSIDEFAERVRSVEEKYPYLVAEAEGKILGYAYVSPFKKRPAYSWAVETSIYIKSDKKRLGIGRRLYETLEKYLQAQGVLNLYACIAFTEKEDEHLTNDSVRFHEKMGYQPVGRCNKCGYKFGRWYDVVYMEKQIGEHVEDQPRVIPFTDIRL
jgi:phosphinothricin acetyltransferase